MSRDDAPIHTSNAPGSTTQSSFAVLKKDMADLSRVNDRFRASPGLSMTRWKPLSSLSGRSTLDFTSCTYNCTTSAPARDPLLRTSIVTSTCLPAATLAGEILRFELAIHARFHVVHVQLHDLGAGSRPAVAHLDRHLDLLAGSHLGRRNLQAAVIERRVGEAVPERKQRLDVPLVEAAIANVDAFRVGDVQILAWIVSVGRRIGAPLGAGHGRIS